MNARVTVTNLLCLEQDTRRDEAQLLRINMSKFDRPVTRKQEKWIITIALTIGISILIWIGITGIVHTAGTKATFESKCTAKNGIVATTAHSYKPICISTNFIISVE